MARFGIVSGLLLCIDTAMALFGSIEKVPLLFIPMMLGIPILFFGVVALNPHRKRQALATAAGVGSLGLLIGCGHLFHFLAIWKNAGSVNMHFTRIVCLMIVICIAFVFGYCWTMIRGEGFRLRRSSSVR
ncbi:hypothetical protein [Roseiconus lacunae]|uniref:Uncharacterized protein n=1 Tax=Roseiconus lacunae TaxID=2605694 RepID=A0ABT7PJL1_9BACT|nr:hypothetical protein [Roseiconus lacunae]MCD0461693.1 hypothetical protein [Roseiconus lacunae]MDM4016660.1 hypothetical protein [Roseiconus lacunae]WRQ49528.1 hypothetical protein U8335_21530 [Stieleria sp. HD01]